MERLVAPLEPVAFTPVDLQEPVAYFWLEAGKAGFEPVISSLTGWRFNLLSYFPL